MTRLILAVFAAFLQLPAPQPQSAAIEGLVLRTDTAEPIAQAQVTVTRVASPSAPAPASNAAGPQAPPPTVLTDNRGRFLIRDLPPGTYRIAAGRNGFARQEYGQRSYRAPGTTLALLAGQELKDVTLRLTPAGAVFGRVTDETGRPLAGVTVQLLRPAYAQTGRRNFQPTVTARTNDLGEYRLYWITPGAYYLNATTAGSYIDNFMQNVLTSAAGAARAQDPSGSTNATAAQLDALIGRNANEISESGFATTYYPGTTNSSRALPVNIGAGAEFRTADLVMSKEQMFRIQGRVVDARNSQTPQLAIVQMAMRGAEQSAPPKTGTFDSSSGTFEFRDVSAGEYTLVAVVPGAGEIAMASSPVDVGGADIRNVVLSVRAGVSIPGRISVENASSLDSLSGLDRMRVRLIPASEAVINAGPPSTITPEGTFTMANVSVGEYRVGILGLASNFYIKAARSGRTDALQQTLSLTGEPPAPLEIVLSPNAAEITGTILDRDSKPVSATQVVLIPDRQRERRELFKSVISDQTGQFRFQGIAPGEYRLYAWDDIDPLAYNNEDILRQYEAQAATANVAESGKLSVNVRIIPAIP